MNRPVSMLDWGMFMLERDLGGQLTVFYSFDENTVYILEDAWGQEFERMEDAEQFCIEKYEDLDRKLLVSDGKDRFEDFCSVCGRFKHNGWTTGNWDKVLIELKDRFSYMTYTSSHTCERKLYGTAVSIIKN